METVTRNAGRKSNARKRAAAATAAPKEPKAPKAAIVKTAPVVDVPNSQQKQISEFIKANKQKVADYMAKHFDEVSEADVETITKEVAECVLLNRSPKAGGVWGTEVDIVEGVITAVAGPKVATVDPKEPLVDSEPEVEEEEADGEQEESEPTESAAEAEVETPSEDQKSLASEPSSDAKTAKTKAKAKKMTSAAKKTAAPAKAKAEPTKKPTKAKAKSNAEEKTDRTPAVSADQIKKLKGKEQWLATARLLKAKKKLWIQAQDIPEVIGHLYDVSIGKAKLKEDGFDGKGEKVYRRNRILGFKESIEGYLKTLK